MKESRPRKFLNQEALEIVLKGYRDFKHVAYNKTNSWLHGGVVDRPPAV